MAKAKQTIGEEPKKTRNFVGLWYPDDETHVKALKCVLENYKCAYILHDKDVDENGEIKKSHWHVVFTLGSNANPRYASGMAKELGVAENYVQECGNLNGALEYLVHHNDPEKHQYSIDEVYGELGVRLKDRLAKGQATEGERMVELIEYLQTRQCYVSVMEFSMFCAQNGYWDVYRRSALICMKMLEEHNERYVKTVENHGKK